VSSSITGLVDNAVSDKRRTAGAAERCGRRALSSLNSTVGVIDSACLELVPSSSVILLPAPADTDPGAVDGVWHGAGSASSNFSAGIGSINSASASGDIAGTGDSEILASKL